MGQSRNYNGKYRVPDCIEQCTVDVIFSDMTMTFGLLGVLNQWIETFQKNIYELTFNFGVDDNLLLFLSF